MSLESMLYAKVFTPTLLQGDDTHMSPPRRVVISPVTIRNLRVEQGPGGPYQQSLENGKPDTLFGLPVAYDDSLAPREVIVVYAEARR